MKHACKNMYLAIFQWQRSYRFFLRKVAITLINKTNSKKIVFLEENIGKLNRLWTFRTFK